MATNVRLLHFLTFKDGSHYSGQILEISSQPHGWGQLQNQGFTHSGFFSNGKAISSGMFKAPNGDVFYGHWNSKSKRHGKGLLIRGKDNLQLVEDYNDGTLNKRLKRKPPSSIENHWLAPSIRNNTSPKSRIGHTLTATTDFLLLYGGEELNSENQLIVTNSLWMLDFSSNEWVNPPSKGPVLSGHTATLFDNRIYFIGGQKSSLELNTSVWILDIQSGKWEVISRGMGFVNHSATLIGDQIWVIANGGVFAFSLQKNEWYDYSKEIDMRGLKRSPRAFISHSAVAYKDHIVVTGGIAMGLVSNDERKWEHTISDVRILDTKELKWSLLETKMPSVKNESVDGEYTGFLPVSACSPLLPRAEHCSLLVNNHLLYIIGGRSTTNPSLTQVDTNWLSDVQILDLETNEWLDSVNKQIWPLPRANFAAVQINEEEIWIFGGSNAASETVEEWEKLRIAKEK